MQSTITLCDTKAFGVVDGGGEGHNSNSHAIRDSEERLGHSTEKLHVRRFIVVSFKLKITS